MRTRRTVAVAAVAAVGLGMLTGCASAPEEATGTLEQIATKAECAPDVQTDATELRQAKCATDDGRYVLTTFTTDRGQREWLNQAKDYGGSYLVGRRWTVSGDAGTVEKVRERLGGQIETTEPHAPHGSPSATASASASGDGHGHGHE